MRNCDECGSAYFYPRDISPCCFSRNTSWVKASGSASLFTYGIVHRPPHPGFMAETPFVTAIVELEEGPKMGTNIVMDDPTPEKLQIGMPLEVVFEDITDADRPAEVQTGLSRQACSGRINGSSFGNTPVGG